MRFGSALSKMRSTVKLGTVLGTVGAATLMMAAPANAEGTAAPPDYTLDLSGSGTSSPGTVGTQQYGTGACYGNFHDPNPVNGFLEWGADSHCSGTGWYPHQLTVTLLRADKIPFFPDIFFEPVGVRASPAWQFGSPDIVIHEHNAPWVCLNTEPTTYRINVLQSAGGRSNVAVSEDFEVNCDIGENY